MTIHNIAQPLECKILMTSFSSFGDVSNLTAVTQCTDFRIGVICSDMLLWAIFCKLIVKEMKFLRVDETWMLSIKC